MCPCLADSLFSLPCTAIPLFGFNRFLDYTGRFFYCVSYCIEVPERQTANTLTNAPTSVDIVVRRHLPSVVSTSHPPFLSFVFPCSNSCTFRASSTIPNSTSPTTSPASCSSTRIALHYISPSLSTLSFSIPSANSNSHAFGQPESSPKAVRKRIVTCH